MIIYTQTHIHSTVYNIAGICEIYILIYVNVYCNCCAGRQWK